MNFGHLAFKLEVWLPWAISMVIKTSASPGHIITPGLVSSTLSLVFLCTGGVFTS